VFEDAAERAGEYTCPFVGLRRRPDKSVFSNIGAFIVLNREGWVLTAAHLMNEIAASRRTDQVAEAVEIWAIPGFSESHPTIAENIVLPAADLALVRLEPFDPGQIAAYPTLRPEDESVRPGMPIARLGYPFHEVKADFDEERKSFDITSGFPVPRFVSDGIVSRFRASRTDDGVEYEYIQTSTPGLRGQSGGPLLDEAGRVCGVQSKTVHFDLGFDAHIERDGERLVEHQVLNVGEAAHVSSVRTFLREHDIECDGL
jgi:hypothetical protein